MFQEWPTLLSQLRYVSEHLHVVMNTVTLKINPFITEPTDSDVEEANNENNLLDPNGGQDDFVNIEDI